MRLISALAALAAAPCVLAQSGYKFASFRPSKLFGDYMVLQRAPQQPRLWGWSDPGSTVVGMLNISSAIYYASAVTDATGLWVLTLPAVAPQWSGVSVMVNDTASGAQAWALNVRVGAVLVCGGQSNQDLPVSYIFNSTAEEALAADYFNRISVFQIPIRSYTGSQTDGPLAEFPLAGPWQAASAASVTGFSAECWLTARYLAEANPGLNIGAIQSDWPGDSIAELSSPAARALCANEAPAASPAAASVPAGLGFPPPIPGPSAGSAQWNAMWAPLAVGPLAVEAFIYHQGEADSMRSSNATEVQSYYTCALTALIADWRALLQAPGAWFGVTQLAPYGDDVHGAGIAAVRQAQWDVCTGVTGLANVTCAVITDDGDPTAPAGSVHSRNKQLVARRLVAGAMATQYDAASTAVYGPVYSSAADTSTAGQLSATVTFTPATSSNTGGLAMRFDVNNTSTCPVAAGIPADACAYFALQSAATGAWVNATTVTILNTTSISLAAATATQGDTVAATAWGQGAYPVVVLYNAAGLPGTPWVARV